MIFIILSVFCSVSVAILLKLAKRYQISIIQAVTVNYLTALTLCWLFFKPQISLLNSTAPWWIYISLGILLPAIFLLLAASIRTLGIVRTDIAQRLSLFIPVLAAYLIFGEQFNLIKLIGLCVGFLAIVLTFARKSEKLQKMTSWIFPISVFIGFGIIDTLFKQIAIFKAVSYTTSLFVVFCIAFLVASIFVLTMVIMRKTKLQLVNVACGFILGILNFGNIYFYLKAHRALAESPTTVFASMNLGVIVVGSLIGILVFKEKLSKLNYLGIFLALFAVILITLSQLNVI